MKLLRYGAPGAEKPGMLDANGRIRDLSGRIDDIDGANLSPSALDQLRTVDPESLPVVADDIRIGACVGKVGKFMAIGLNYYDHAAETGMPVPDEPLLFTKYTSCISGPNDDVVIPRGSTRTDWEVELGIVIGSSAKHVSEADAPAHIAGYCVVNDVSERSFQLEGTGQWVKGKSCDTFGPIGPWLVTADEVPDPTKLALWLEVDGQRHQDSSTAQMIFSPARIVSYLSGFFTLHPGDLITTGTPPGVGAGIKPDPVFLKPGQEMRLSVEGLGVQVQRTVAEG